MKGALLLLPLALMVAVPTGCTLKVQETKEVHYRSEPSPPPWAPAHGHRRRFRYRYYPEVQVYFDIDRNLYFYFWMGEWRWGPSLPPGLKLKGGFVILEMGTDRPFLHHHEVLKAYPPKGRKGR